MGKPIILGVEGESQKLIKDYGAGVSFEPENKADLIDKLELLKNDRSLYKKCQKNGYQLASDFDRVKLAKRMYKHILEVAYNGSTVESTQSLVQHKITDT